MRRKQFRRRVHKYFGRSSHRGASRRVVHRFVKRRSSRRFSRGRGGIRF